MPETKESKEHLLAAVMKKKLSDVLHEGLLDSVLPYMIPKPAFSQPIIKKPLMNPDIKKSRSTGNVESKTSISVLKDKDNDKKKEQKKAYEYVYVRNIFTFIELKSIFLISVYFTHHIQI